MNIKKKSYTVVLMLIMTIMLVVCVTNLSNESVAFASEADTNLNLNGGDSEVSYIEAYIADAKSARMQYMSTYSDFFSRDYFRSGCSFSRRVGEGMKATIFADDSIVNIIPKQYFYTAGEHINITAPYGYYINSRSNEGYNEVTVIIFKIDEVLIDYEATISITTVFSADYYYISSSSAAIHYYNSSNGSIYTAETIHINFTNNIANAVIPAISVQCDSLNLIEKYYFVQSKQYQLKDISFASRIYNADSLNQGDIGYNVDNDYGYFIIGNRYDYSSTNIVSGNENATFKQVLEIGVSSVLSMTPYVGNIFSITNTGVTLKNIVDSANEEISYDETNQNYYYSGFSTYNTRATQYAHYGNLIRGSAITLNSSDNNSLLFRENNYAKGIFNISHTDRADGIMPHGKIYFDIALKVVNRTNNNVTAFLNTDTISMDINSPYTKTATTFNTNDYYMLPDGSQTFAYTPQYTGNYTIAQTGTFALYLNDAQQTAQNGIYNVYLKKNVTYSIEMKNTSTSPCYGTFAIEYANAGASNSFALDYNDVYVMKYRPATSGFYAINCGENAVLTDVKTLDANKQFTHYKYCNDKRSFEEYFEQGTDYYILVKKTQDDTQNVTVGISPVTRTLSVGENPSITLSAGENYVYYKFVVPSNAASDATYNFIFAGLTTDDLSYSIRTEDGKQIVNLMPVSKDYICTNSLTAGKTYYLGIKSSSNVTVTPKFTIGEASHAWTIYQDGGTSPYLTTSGDSIIIPRGHTYKFALTVEGINIEPIFYSGPEVDHFNNIDTITISSTISLSINATFSGINKSFCLNIQYTLDESEVSVEIDYENQVLLTFTLPDDILGLSYKLEGADANGNEFVINKYADISGVDVLADLVSENAYGIANFIINYVSVINKNTIGPVYVPANISQSINCRYSYTQKGLFNTTKCYITNALQLNNLRHNNNMDVYLGNDINLAASYSEWTPIPLYKGRLHGNGHSIKGLNITIKNDSLQRYGLFENITALQSNVLIEDVNITTASNYNSTKNIFVGAFAGTSNEGGLFQCFAYGNIIVNAPNAIVGGLVGWMTGSTVSICGFGYNDSRSRIASRGDIGGIVGNAYDVEFQGDILNNTDICSTIYDNSYSIGGTVGFLSGGSISTSKITNSSISNVNTSSVSSSYAPKMGFIVGHALNTTFTGSIEDSTYSTGKLTNTSNCFNGDRHLYGINITTITDTE